MHWAEAVLTCEAAYEAYCEDLQLKPDQESWSAFKASLLEAMEHLDEVETRH